MLYIRFYVFFTLRSSFNHLMSVLLSLQLRIMLFSTLLADACCIISEPVTSIWCYAVMREYMNYIFSDERFYSWYLVLFSDEEIYDLFIFCWQVLFMISREPAPMLEDKEKWFVFKSITFTYSINSYCQC